MSSCFRFVSIYRSLSFIYMWTVTVMTLHTLQFNPIIDILTRKKVTKKKIIFSAFDFLLSFVRPQLGPLAILRDITANQPFIILYQSINTLLTQYRTLQVITVRIQISFISLCGKFLCSVNIFDCITQIYNKILQKEHH